MQKLSVARWFVVLGFSALMAGCAGAEWQQVTVAPNYQAPKQLKVALVSASGAQNSEGAMQALQAAMADTLSSKGINATFVPAPSGPPDGNMSVAEWNQGSRALRWLIGFGAGEGTIVVSVKSPSADGQPGVDGTARGWVRGGFFGGSSYEAAKEAGVLIAKAIITGKAKAK
jgi:uncharacterized protein DUF4410